MTRTDLTTTLQGDAQHTRLRPDWYLSGSLENDRPPPVERRGFGRALVSVILKGGNEHLRARRFRSPGRTLIDLAVSAVSVNMRKALAKAPKVVRREHA